MLTENNITIYAPVDRIFALAADVLRWPEILPHYRWVRLIKDDGESRIVEMAALRDGIPVKWTSIQRPVPHENKIIFRHIGGFTKGMYVEWTMREEKTTEGLAVHVKITHEWSLAWPIIGPFIAEHVIGRFFVHNIAGKTLTIIKFLSEHTG